MRPDPTSIPGTYDEMDDAELLHRMAGADEIAMATLYDRYSRVIFSFALRIIGDRATAEELLQEVFFRTWVQADRFSERRGSCVTWMLSITHNLAIDEVRKRNRRPKAAESADPVLLLANQHDTAPSTEEHALLSDLRDHIRQALALVPENQRHVIVLAYFEGLTQREIADQLGEPLGTVKTRLRLGIQKLHHAMERYEMGLA